MEPPAATERLNKLVFLPSVVRTVLPRSKTRSVRRKMTINPQLER